MAHESPDTGQSSFLWNRLGDAFDSRGGIQPPYSLARTSFDQLTVVPTTEL